MKAQSKSWQIALAQNCTKPQPALAQELWWRNCCRAATQPTRGIDRASRHCHSCASAKIVSCIGNTLERKIVSASQHCAGCRSFEGTHHDTIQLPLVGTHDAGTHARPAITTRSHLCRHPCRAGALGQQGSRGTNLQHLCPQMRHASLA